MHIHWYKKVGDWSAIYAIEACRCGAVKLYETYGAKINLSDYNREMIIRDLKKRAGLLAGEPDCYAHTNTKGVTYYLHKKDVSLRGGRMMPIYFFKKNVGDKDISTGKPYEAVQLPEGWTVNENPRNGFLSVRRPQTEEHSYE